MSEMWKGSLDIELTLLDQLEEQLSQVETQLNQLAKQDKQVQLLQTMPGLGRRTAEVIVRLFKESLIVPKLGFQTS